MTVKFYVAKVSDEDGNSTEEIAISYLDEENIAEICEEYGLSGDVSVDYIKYMYSNKNGEQVEDATDEEAKMLFNMLNNKELIHFEVIESGTNNFTIESED